MRAFGAMTRFYPPRANAIGFVNVEQILTEVEGLMGRPEPSVVTVAPGQTVSITLTYDTGIR